MARMIELPHFPVEGGCQCGAVRYTLSAPPLGFWLCHCTECQKQSASAFGESLQVAGDTLQLRGETASFTRDTESGRRMDCRFCPACGVRLLHRLVSGGDTVNLRGGTLDDASWLVPAGHIWTGSRQRWMVLPEDSLAYQGNGDVEALRARWREMTGIA